LVGRSEQEALETFHERFRRSLKCIADADVYGSGHSPGRLNTITLYPHNGTPGNVVPLRTRDGRADLRLGVYHHYTVVHLPNDVTDREPFKISSSRYMYELLDRDEREIFVYHWHPEGVSTFLQPHMHFSGASPIALAPGLGDIAPRYLAIDKAHFPTGRTPFEDVVALLIREFDVAWRRDDWEEILRDNLAAIQRGRTW
jgi:hypothetical protein